MTREEEYQKAAHEYINSDAVKPENMQMAYGDFINGAKWADEHPKNPWKDPKVELPNEGEIVLTKMRQTIDGGGEHLEDEMIQVQKYIGRWITDRAEQHRMSGILFDTISKVTAWMPIPIGGEQ